MEFHADLLTTPYLEMNWIRIIYGSISNDGIKGDKPLEFEYQVVWELYV